MATKGRPGNRGPCTAAQHDSRVNQVEDWLLANWTRSDIIRAMKDRWGLEPRTVDDYIADARKRWAEEASHGRGEARKEQIRRLKRLAREAVKAKSWRAALGAEAQLARLEGTDYQPGDDIKKDAGTEVIFEIDAPGDDDEEGEK